MSEFLWYTRFLHKYLPQFVQIESDFQIYQTVCILLEFVYSAYVNNHIIVKLVSGNLLFIIYLLVDLLSKIDNTYC